MAEGQSVNPAAELQTESHLSQPERWGCEHYRRRARLVAPCCGRLYWCRLCHDAAELHSLDRHQVSEVQCSACDLRQAVGPTCQRCHTQFGEYFCFTCRLYDASRDQYHCDDCGLCRVGGRQQTFHCHRCGTCRAGSPKDAHWCLPGGRSGRLLRLSRRPALVPRTPAYRPVRPQRPRILQSEDGPARSVLVPPLLRPHDGGQTGLEEARQGSAASCGASNTCWRECSVMIVESRACRRLMWRD